MLESEDEGRPTGVGDGSDVSLRMRLKECPRKRTYMDECRWCLRSVSIEPDGVR